MIITTDTSSTSRGGSIPWKKECGFCRVCGGAPCREQTGIITEVLPDGIIIQADGYVDISEEYSIMKIEKPVVYQENGML